MRLVSLLGTWLGLIIMAIAIWLLPFVDGLAQGNTFLDFSDDAGRFGLSAMARWFSEWGYMLTYIMVFGLAPFAAVGPSRPGRVVGAIGYCLLAVVVIGAVVSAWSVLDVTTDPWDRFMVGLMGLMGLLSLIGAVCAAFGRSHWVAVPAMLFTVVGVVCSQRLLVQLGEVSHLELFQAAWALPVGYLVTMVALLGSFLTGTRLGPDGARRHPHGTGSAG